ncbi:MAG: YbaN family protein [Bacteroidetes bacterium]|nr:YbaN family protein [Bacteroidota bacterium]
MDKNKSNKKISKFNKQALVLAGHSFVGLGILGMILPLMPTTVFLLLAAACYAKSSPQFYSWLHTNKYFGKHLKNYKDKKGTPLSVKVFSLVFLWLSMLFSIYTIKDNSNFIYITILLLIIAGAVTIHLLTLKTYKEKEEK